MSCFLLHFNLDYYLCKHYPVENVYLYCERHFPLVPIQKSCALWDNFLVYSTSLVANNYLGLNKCSVHNHFHFSSECLVSYCSFQFRLLSLWNIIQLRMFILNLLQNFHTKLTVSLYLFFVLRLLGCHPVLFFFLFVLLLLLLLLLLMYSRDVPFISEMFALPPLPFFSYFLSFLYFRLFSLYHTTHNLVVVCTDAANPTDESELAFRSREKSLSGLLILWTASYPVSLILFLL